MTDKQSKISTIICTTCPMGCSLEVATNEMEIVSIKGNGCKRGISYAKAEVTNPTRVLTTTVRTSTGEMIAVKTDRPIEKSKMLQCMKEINTLMPTPPIKANDVLIENIQNTQANLIATTHSKINAK